MQTAQTSIDFAQGVILIDKPYQWTSFDIVGKIKSLIKHQLKIKTKVGHAGTLDPLATGLLILCTGSNTKRIEEFQALEKEYIGTMILGATRPSFDMETEIDNTYEIGSISREELVEATKTFTGNISQIPPLFSAKKIEGQRAYEFARKGIEKKLEPKNVLISKFEITKINLPEISFCVVCSKGTYIRSLVHDFGKKLNNGAYLSELRRTRIGKYHVDNAHNIEQIEEIIKLKTED